MHGEKTPDGLTRDPTAAEEEFGKNPTDKRHFGERVGGDDGGPFRQLVPWEDIAGEAEAERRGQKQDSNKPGELAWAFVGAIPENLQQMAQQDDDDETDRP